MSVIPTLKKIKKTLVPYRHTDAETDTNLVPGVELLGFGYNIFGTYSFDNVIRQMFDLGALTPWTSSSGTTYNLPANVTEPDGSSSSASSQSFSTASEFNSYFQRSASVSGSIGAFSASFSSSYSTEQQNSSSNTWALVEADFKAWQVSLNYAPGILLAEITGDPDWNLPQTFDPTNRQNMLAFFRFFQKFGTHFVSSVVAGGTLYYYFAISDSANYSATQISLSASAEYSGLISSTSVSASQNWGQCAANWTENRQSHAMTVPATSAVVDWVNPLSGTYDSDGSFAAWKQAVNTTPSRTKFQLTPIWALFSGAQWAAIQQAFAAYANNRIAVEAYTSNYTDATLINGQPITPTNGYPATLTPGWHLVVLDAKTLEVQLNKYYTFPAATFPLNWPDATYDAMSADMQPYAGSSDAILVASTTYIDSAANPTSEFSTILRSFGAGSGLDQWQQISHGCSNGYGSAAYVLVGVGGSSNGIESFADTNMPTPLPPSLEVTALLLPLDDSFTPTPYQQ
jgi:MAC/Perforin domain